MSIELNPMKRNHLVIRVTIIALFTSNIGTNERLQFDRQFNQISAAADPPPPALEAPSDPLSKPMGRPNSGYIK